MTGQVPRRPGPGRLLATASREDMQKSWDKFVGFCCNLSNLVVTLRKRGRPKGGPKRLIGRMIAMKRLPALMLSVFLLTLLSLPATAENVNKEGTVPIPVELSVDASTMVDVTITWDDFKYVYNGREFTTNSGKMPGITVTNNNPQNSILVTPDYQELDGLNLDSRAFALYFFKDANVTTTKGGDVEKVTLTGAESTTFYAVPEGNPLKYAPETKNSTIVGNILIKIELGS